MGSDLGSVNEWFSHVAEEHDSEARRSERQRYSVREEFRSRIAGTYLAFEFLGFLLLRILTWPELFQRKLEVGQFPFGILCQSESKGSKTRINVLHAKDVVKVEVVGIVKSPR